MENKEKTYKLTQIKLYIFEKAIHYKFVTSAGLKKWVSKEMVAFFFEQNNKVVLKFSIDIIIQIL